MKAQFHNLTANDYVALEQLLNKVFKSITDDKNIQIIFVDNFQIKHFNNQYRNIDKETDVLSFPNDEDSESLGDVFISVEKAVTQANEYGHSLNREIGFLAVHGYLHLKGYDHHTKEEENEMFALQEEILTKANLKR